MGRGGSAVRRHALRPLLINETSGIRLTQLGRQHLNRILYHGDEPVIPEEVSAA